MGTSGTLDDYRASNAAGVAASIYTRKVLPLCKVDRLTRAGEHADVIDICCTVVCIIVVDHGLVCLSLCISKLVAAELLMRLQMAHVLCSSVHRHGHGLDADQAVIGDILSSVELTRLHHQYR